MIRLKKDIVIPAGTIMDEAPRNIELSPGHFIYTVGLTPNTSGDFIYFFRGVEAEELKEWFEEI